MNKIKKIYLATLICLLFFVIATSAQATTTPAVETTKLAADSLIKGGEAKVYLVIDDGQRRWITDEATFNALGYSWSAITTITDAELDQYPLGDPLTAKNNQPILPTLAETEAAVKSYFADTPVMISIAQCESGFRQYNNDGTVLRGSNLYIGIFQIDEKIHAAIARNLGMDIYTLEGNLAYAAQVYKEQGTRPWIGCVKNSPSSVSGGMLTNNLKIGDTDPQVKILQQRLNNLGFNIAKSGPGSSGNETEYFGQLTRSAVQRFQCSKGIACDGSESTTGYGQVGPKTRAALNY